MKSCLLITTMNRTALLRHTFERLLARTLPDEILVVDDGGNDGCDQLVEEWVDTLPVRRIYNNNPGRTLCSLARNIGIRHTDADIVITSEPEIMFVTDVIPQLLDRHAQNPSDVISAGVVYHAQGDSVREPSQCRRIDGWVAPFTALYEREWLLAIQGWDEAFPGPWGWDDTDLLTRLRLMGHGQVVAPEIEVLHQWHGGSADNQTPNENHFLAKGFNDGNLEHVIANKGREWGQLK